MAASEAADHSFSYFTDLGYWGLAFYFAFAAAHTGSYALTGRPWLASWPAVLRWFAQCSLCDRHCVSIYCDKCVYFGFELLVGCDS